MICPSSVLNLILLGGGWCGLQRNRNDKKRSNKKMVTPMTPTKGNTHALSVERKTHVFHCFDVILAAKSIFPVVSVRNRKGVEMRGILVFLLFSQLGQGFSIFHLNEQADGGASGQDIPGTAQKCLCLTS